MKPWREVLAERGWERDKLPKGVSYEQWSIEGNDDTRWRFTMERMRQGWNPLVWRSVDCIAELEGYAGDEESAFAALLALPIGPGRVTVGVLLGVAT